MSNSSIHHFSRFGPCASKKDCLPLPSLCPNTDIDGNVWCNLLTGRCCAVAEEAIFLYKASESNDSADSKDPSFSPSELPSIATPGLSTRRSKRIARATQPDLQEATSPQDMKAGSLRASRARIITLLEDLLNHYDRRERKWAS